ncbi:hypothetical protein [Parabacteroides sp. PF5-9]|uniref:hypothetical protein n=1 Tax=Parabacteroides sp. PF5-9 TaxID=1742404 RepID=UPI002475FE02|nr:hypothetical protein [Parabacteroides sp. PF5-9]MDH6356513.1 YD repeat-containing protein [Parabacteroides sp. PF5-9]
MKKRIKCIAILFILFMGSSFLTTLVAQVQEPVKKEIPQATLEKRERRKNQVVKEMNTDAKGKRQWMDHLTVWDEDGLKLEEIEYAVYGQRERVTFEYDEYGKCIRENVYNDKNKLYRIRKFEYFEDGRKKIQYNYNPDGKLYSTKIFEYSYKDAE